MRTFRNLLLPTLFLVIFGLSLTHRYTPIALERKAPDVIEVEIKGEVQSPGVYTLKNGAVVKDLIKTAGGLTELGDDGALSLMDPLHPGQVIVVAKKAADGTSKLVSISTATKEQLQTLPGIGPAMAQRIIDHRQSQPFTRLEDLMEVKGIGEKKFEKLKEFIAL